MAKGGQKRDARGRFAGGGGGGTNSSGTSAIHKGFANGKTRSHARLNARGAALAKVAASTQPKKGAPVQDLSRVMGNLLKRGAVNRQRVAIGKVTGAKVVD